MLYYCQGNMTMYNINKGFEVIDVNFVFMLAGAKFI